MEFQFANPIDTEMDNTKAWPQWIEHLNEIPCAAYVVKGDEDMTLLSGNKAFYRLLGCSPKELRSKYGSRLGAMLDGASFDALTHLIKNWEPGNSMPVDLRQKFVRDGKSLWVFTDIVCVNSAEGLLLYCTSFDVSNWESRRQRNDEFMESSQFVLGQVGIDSFSYDAKTGSARIFGAGAILPAGLADSSGCCPEFLSRIVEIGIVRPAYEALFQDAFAGMDSNQKQVCELQMISAAQSAVWVRMTLAQKQSPQGNCYIFGMLEDITQQKGVAQNYLNETLLYQSILSDQTAYAQVDATEDHITRIGGLWRIYAEIIDKVTYSELIREFINKIVHPEDREHYLEVMQRTNFIESLENGIDRLSCDFRRIVEQNKMVWMRLRVYISRDPVTHHIFALLCIKDINKEKQQELQLASLRNEHSAYNAAADKIVMSELPFDAFVAEQGDIAYLVDPDTYDLICANQAMFDRLGVTPEECLGMKCYEAMQKRTSPCPFCGKANWCSDQFFIWKNLNMALEQEFLIKNKLVQWEGREVLLALAVDISNNKSVVASLENGMMESHSILVGVQRIAEAGTVDEVMLSALETIGSFFRADIARLWQKDPKTNLYTCTYQWCKHGKINVDCSIDNTVNQWIAEQDWGKPVLTDSPEAMLCQSYPMYECMIAHGVRNQRWHRIFVEGQEEGFLSICNISSNFQNMAFLESFSIFVSGELRQRGLMEQLRNAANCDSLTNLLSRYSFEHYLENFQPDEQNSVGVLIGNFNNLTHINSAHGFNMGNYYLCQFAEMLRQVFPVNCLYRLNGDEFLAIVPNIGRQELEKKLGELEANVRKGENFTVSFGFSWDDVEKDLRVLINQATEAMKVNKKRHYDECPITEDSERRAMLSELVTALQNREYEAFLQPKVEIETGAVVGAEALIRYHHKTLGIIPPAQFIDVLERNNFIRYIDLFVFEEVCRWLEKWAQEGVNPLPRVSLNFSRMTLQERDILTTVETIIANYDVPRKNIEIEITESVANMGKSILYQTAHDLYQAGFAISLDDFGTKYTNLSILADIEFSVLKLDRSLVNKLEVLPHYRVVLRNIIRMCEELKIEVIAEGVETVEQEEILHELGCHFVQGYLHGKPMPIGEFEKQLPQTVGSKE